jgi:hypothetical protein
MAHALELADVRHDILERADPVPEAGGVLEAQVAGETAEASS